MLKVSIEKQLGTLNLKANVEFPQGVSVIFGRSGAGKSSLINLIAGLSTPDNGQIVFHPLTNSSQQRPLFDKVQKINLPPEKRRIGYVFQEHRLFPHYNVEKNLKYGTKRLDSKKFLQIVDLLGINSLLKHFPATLSGGEKQRVAIGRALLSEPDILLMDEPLSALDLPRKQELLGYLNQFAKRAAIPILYVTHNLDEVIHLADRLLILENGKVIAFDHTLNVWHSLAFQPWQPDGEKLSLLELPMIGIDLEHKMQSLSIGKQQIWIPLQQHQHQEPRYQAGNRIRITIASRDVSITLSKPEKSSIRNILTGTICKIIEQSDRLDILIRVENDEIWATISYWAFRELNLHLDQAVFLQIKAISL